MGSLDLAAYGLYAIEAAVVAAALHRGLPLQRSHWSKAIAARELATQVGLPDVADLMRDLNELRKSEAHGDVPVPDRLDAQEIARAVDEYVKAVSALLAR